MMVVLINMSMGINVSVNVLRLCINSKDTKEEWPVSLAPIR